MELVCLEDGDVVDFLRFVYRSGCRCRVVCSGGMCRLYVDHVPSSLGVRRGLAAWLSYLAGKCRVVVPLPRESLPLLGGGLGSGGGGGGVCFDVVGGGSACLGLDVFWRHLGVFGSTGSGKSTTAAYIASRLAEEGVLVLVFDWHGEYGSLLEGWGAKPYVYGRGELPRLPIIPAGDIDAAVEVLGDALGLTDNQSLLLTDLLEGIRSYCVAGEATGRLSVLLHVGGWPRLEELLGRLCGGRGSLRVFTRFLAELYNKLYVVESRGERESWAALIRRLRLALREESVFELESGSMDDVLRLPPDGVIVFDLSGIRSTRSRALYALLMARLLYEDAYRSKNTVDSILVFEEAHHVAPRRGSIGGGVLSLLAEEARKYHIGLVVVEQSPSLLDASLLSNINTVILHRIHSAADLNALRTITPHVGELEKTLPLLKPGEAVLASTSLPAPTPIIIRPGNSRPPGM